MAKDVSILVKLLDGVLVVLLLQFREPGLSGFEKGLLAHFVLIQIIA